MRAFVTRPAIRALALGFVGFWAGWWILNAIATPDDPVRAYAIAIGELVGIGIAVGLVIPERTAAAGLAAGIVATLPVLIWSSGNVEWAAPPMPYLWLIWAGLAGIAVIGFGATRWLVSRKR